MNTINCSENNLSCLNANNGAVISVFNCSNNPMLNCVSVLDPSVAPGMYYYYNAPQTCFSQYCAILVNNDVAQVGMEIITQVVGANYQWLDCDNNNAIIVGANGQSYTATSTGN